MNDDLTYAGSGVDYDAMDPFKRLAQLAGRATARNLKDHHHGVAELEESRGESAYLIDIGHRILAHVEEGLGTKNLVADAMCQVAGRSYYNQIAQDTVAMIVNDMATLGAMPLSVAMHLAVGESAWFEDEMRVQALVAGWRHACNLAQCAWGGGETPTLGGIVSPGTVVLSGSAIGEIFPKRHRIRGDIADGDAIVFVSSSGIHANGLTLARRIAERLPQGYATPLREGGSTSYGAALLAPTPIYVPFVRSCLRNGVAIHYAVNVTGHGWRKLMRAPGDFTYVISNLPPRDPLFDFIQKHGPVADREAYATFNMGAGFAIYVSPADVPRVHEAARSCAWGPLGQHFDIWEAGHIERGPRKVVIEPKGIEFEAATLGVR